MRNLIAIFLLAASTVMVLAQESKDTIAVQELKEIVIEAPKVIHKADMDVYHPSRSAVDNAKNGVQLLSNLMIPSLSVSDALGTISKTGIMRDLQPVRPIPPTATALFTKISADRYSISVRTKSTFLPNTFNVLTK